MATCRMCIKIFCAIFTFIGICFNFSDAQSFFNVSVLVRNHVASLDSPTIFEVFKPSRQLVMIYMATLVKGDALVNDSLHFQGVNFTERINESYPTATLTLGEREHKSGIYTVKFGDGQTETELRVMILNSSALVIPTEPYVVVTAGENVTLGVDISAELNTSPELRWRKNGSFLTPNCFGSRLCEVKNATESTVYECFEGGKYGERKHAMINVIVRACPVGWWGPATNCSNKCPRCFNGGICSDKIGLCQCPPGFSGSNCEKVHGRNVFGQHGEHKCNETGNDHSDGCKGALICYQEPFGCVCPAGYFGLDCSKECEDGTFGANCKQTCHCQHNVSCAKDTGVCENNECGSNWTGENCQVEDPCTDGMYGILCDKECSCQTGEDCREVEENCQRGCAIPWTGLACNQSVPSVSITYIKVNPGVSTNVTCSAVSNPVITESELMLYLNEMRYEGEKVTSSEDERGYIRSNTWMVSPDSSESSPATARCSFNAEGIEVNKDITLEPFELPSYRGGNPLNVSWSNSTFIKTTWREWVQGIDNGDGPIVNYEIRYRIRGPSEWKYEKVPRQTFEAELPGLSPDTEYVLQLRAVRQGQNGEGRFHDRIFHWTPCGVPSERPTLTFMSQPNANSAQFSVQIPEENTWNCRSITVDLQRRRQDGTWRRDKPLESSSASTTVSDLIPCSSYSFRIIMYTIRSSPVYSPPITVETQPAALDPVTRLQVTGQNDPTQLSVSWEAPDTSQNNCPIHSYNLKYRRLEYRECAKNNASDVMERTTLVSSYILRDLEPNAIYEVKVQANGLVNSSTETQNGQTSETAPSAAPRDVQGTIIRPTSLQLQWLAPQCESRNGDIVGYYYRLAFLNGSSFEEDNHRGSRSVTINNLTPYTEYSFTVLALTSTGAGPFSELVTYRTAEDRPPKLLPPVFPFANRSIIAVQWNKPHPPHGVITKYEISYRRENEEEQVTMVTAEIAGDPPSYILSGLESSTNYTVKVRAYTSVGSGPYSEQLVQITKEGLPGPPANLNISHRTLMELTVVWNIPDKPKGKITKYELQYQAIAKPYLTEFVGEPPVRLTLNNPMESNSHQITGLKPSTVYKIQVSAYTSAGQGEFETINGTTAVYQELEEADVNEVTIKRRTDTTAEMVLPALTQQYATGYRIRIQSLQSKRKRAVLTWESYEDDPDNYITAELSKQENDISFTVGDNKIYGGYRNAPLDEDKKYNLYIITISRVGEEVEAISSGPISLQEESGGSAVTVILILLLIAIMVLVAGIVWYKRRDLTRLKDDILQNRKGRKQDGAEVPSKVLDIEMNTSESLDNLANQDFNHSATNGKQPVKKKSLRKIQKGVKISDLASYVNKKKTSGKDNFTAEYEMLPQGQLYSWDVAAKPENKTKNRYGNIIPYDGSRVVLPVINDNPHSDYINASYIDGYQMPNKYIACHGPNKASVLDFWRMVWLENCGKIVMLTNLQEGGKKKCEKYWPDDVMKYGNIKVVCTNTNVYPTCTISTLSLSQMNDEATIKHVRHFHFTAWPDMKVPDFAGPLLDFLQLIREEEPYQDGPVVVHCSAGVGRTGTYITLDAMLDVAAAEDRVNVFQFVSHLRERRIKMVQVVEQYQFIYDALVEYFIVGNTSIQMETFRSELSQLKVFNKRTQKSSLQEQFETLQLVSITPPAEKFSGARNPENKNKNRFHDCLPVDSYRPYLMTDVGSHGNNYINASFLGGLQNKNMFLATQMPLENTILDFWRMVWDYKSSAIVMLNDMNAGLVQYWPESGTYQCDPFEITVLSCNVQQGICCRNLEIANPSQTLEGPKEVMHLQFTDWPIEAEAPESPQTLLQAISMLTQWTDEKEEGPITVHCINGIGRTGIFCSLMTALEQVKLDGKADIFQIVNKMRNCRPNMVETFEQYQSIFDILLMTLEDDNIYENFSK